MKAAGDATWSAMAVLTMLAAVLTVAHGVPQGPTDGDPNLNPTDNLYATCTTGDKRGMCLRDYQCFPNGTIAEGGDIAQGEIRDSSAPITDCGEDFWCCTYASDANPPVSPTRASTPSPTSISSAAGNAACSRVFDEDCTWCVGLYRPGGDVQREQRTASGLYCGGALLGSRVVLTAATCARAAGQEAVRARVPGSAAPDKEYAVVDRILHPKYSTGTHANDFALMVLNEDVQWLTDGNNGGCVELRKPMEGDCIAIGFSALEQLVASQLSVRDGSCRRKRARGGGEVACGRAQPGQCQAATGAPVLCPVTVDGQGGMALAGVVRQHCIGDSVLMGKVQAHADWLSNELHKLGLEPIFYNPS
ncbi:unnamed protein product, partial [Iphiclides podalirius]